MLLNDLTSGVDAGPTQPVVRGQLDPGLQPELGLAAGMLHVDVGPGLLT